MESMELVFTMIRSSCRAPELSHVLRVREVLKDDSLLYWCAAKRSDNQGIGNALLWSRYVGLELDENI